MILVTLAIAAGTMLVMAVILSSILGWANKTFKVEVDPKIESVSTICRPGWQGCWPGHRYKIP